MKVWNRKFACLFSVLLWVVPVLSLGSALFLFSSFPAYAAGGMSRLADFADLLSDNEESELSDLLDEISDRQQVDVVVVTVDSLDGESAMVYADDFYDYNGYGFGDGRDGILLLISMEERDWYISTAGYGITAITDAGLEYISEIVAAGLSAGDYAAAFTDFAGLCDDFITQARSGEPYDADNLPQGSFGVGGKFAAAFLTAFIISLIATGIMKGQLKTVHSQPAADNYVKQGSMQLTKKNDLFLYRQVERRRKTESGSKGGSETHASSSGTVHGGGGGEVLIILW